MNRYIKSISFSLFFILLLIFCTRPLKAIDLPGVDNNDKYSVYDHTRNDGNAFKSISATSRNEGDNEKYVYSKTTYEGDNENELYSETTYEEDNENELYLETITEEVTKDIEIYEGTKKPAEKTDDVYADSWTLDNGIPQMEVIDGTETASRGGTETNQPQSVTETEQAPNGIDVGQTQYTTGVGETQNDIVIGQTQNGTDTGLTQNDTDTGQNQNGTDTGQTQDDTDTWQNQDGTDTGQNQNGTDTGQTQDGTDTGQNQDDTDTGQTQNDTDTDQTPTDTDIGQTQNDTDTDQTPTDTDIGQTQNDTDTDQTQNDTDTDQTPTDTDIGQTPNDTGMSQTQNDTDIGQTPDDTDIGQTPNDTDISQTQNDTDISQTQNDIDTDQTQDGTATGQTQDDTDTGQTQDNLEQDGAIISPDGFPLSEGAKDEEVADKNAPLGSGVIPRANIIDAESVVVYNFDEFNSMLSGKNPYVNIYLGANIEMKSSGISIDSTKKSVMISGINPLNGAGPHTINELDSVSPAYTIRVELNSGTKEIIMKDVNVVGRNFYGAVCAYDVAYGVNITFENVNYSGPQLSYNRNGVVRIIGNSTIRIQEGHYTSSRSHELAEVRGLELGGNVVINHYAPVVSGVWLVGSDSYIKILQGAKVSWNETGTYMIFQDSLTPAQFIMEEDSEFSLTTLNGLFYNTLPDIHRFSNVIIGRGAMLKIVQGPEATSLPILKVRDSIRISENASLIISSQGSPELILATGTGAFEAILPDTLVLLNKTGNLIEYFNSNSHNTSILSSFVNYWRTPCDLEILGSFDDSPLYRWRKKNGSDLSLNINASSSSTISVTSNYTDEDYGTAPSEELLNLQAARLLTAGNMHLTIDMLMDSSEYITGETEANATLRATYTNKNGELKTVFGNADSSGAYEIAVQDGDSLMEGSTVEVISRYGYKNVIDSKTVTKAEDNRLMFIHVPNKMVFPKTNINLQRMLIPRMDEDWSIGISDTRTESSEWSLYARLLSPLKGKKDDYDHIIDSSIVYIDDTGDKMIMGDGPIKVAKGIKSDRVETLVGWPASKGVHLDIDTTGVYSNVQYTASLEWILVDGP